MKKASLFLIFSAFCFAVMNLSVRLMGDIPTFQKAFFRNILPLIISSYFIFKQRPSFKLQKGAYLFIFIRVFFGTVGVLANFYSVDHLNLANAAIFNKLSPFFVIILSAIFLKEKIKPYQLIALIVAFAGVYVLSDPSGASFDLNHLVALGGGLAAGIAYTSLRHATKNLNVDVSIVIFAFALFSCIVTLIPTILNYAPMNKTSLLFALLAGIAATGGQYGITIAYRLAAANRISIFDYSNVIFNFIFGLFIFNEVIKLNTIVGILMIFGASLYMFIKNSHQKAV